MTSDFKSAIALIRQGNWNDAHEIVQSVRDPMACWIHAWLHRQEGDDGNARYWYSQAGKSFPDFSLEEELNLIAQQIDDS